MSGEDFVPETEEDLVEEKKGDGVGTLVSDEGPSWRAKGTDDGPVARAQEEDGPVARAQEEEDGPVARAQEEEDGPVARADEPAEGTSAANETPATGEEEEELCPPLVHDFEQRFLNNKWIGRYASSDSWVEHVNDEWTPLKEDETEFIQQLWYEQQAAETQVVDGVTMRWNAATQSWQKDDVIDEDFIAQYQMNYGVQYDYSKMDEERKAQEDSKPKPPPAESKKRKKGGAPEPQPQGWVDMEEKVHAVYVSNLPLDYTDDEFKALMTKCGLIQPDARTSKPKLKLYRDEEGNVKGDGRCCYIKKESVDLALNILDGFRVKDHEIKVEKAHFELKGEFNPSLKRKKMTPAQKKAYMDKQKRMFEWKPDKPRNYRPLSDCTVIIKNIFTWEMMAKDASLLLDLKEEVEQRCSQYGAVKKVVVYDNNPEGVVSVTFQTTEESDATVKMLNGVVVDGRKLDVSLWDGRTKYKVEETEEQYRERKARWDRHLAGEDQQDEDEERAAEQSPDLVERAAEQSPDLVERAAEQVVMDTTATD